MRGLKVGVQMKWAVWLVLALALTACGEDIEMEIVMEPSAPTSRYLTATLYETNPDAPDAPAAALQTRRSVSRQGAIFLFDAELDEDHDYYFAVHGKAMEGALVTESACGDYVVTSEPLFFDGGKAPAFVPITLGPEDPPGCPE